MFELGSILITPGANVTLNKSDMMISLDNHKSCDFGEVTDDAIKMNHDAIKNKLFNVFSSYRDRNGIKFYVITEFVNNKTTILLPSEY